MRASSSACASLITLWKSGTRQTSQRSSTLSGPRASAIVSLSRTRRLSARWSSACRIRTKKGFRGFSSRLLRSARGEKKSSASFLQKTERNGAKR